MPIVKKEKINPENLTPEEEQFYQNATKINRYPSYDIYRNGWPDFLLLPNSRRKRVPPLAIEIKKEGSSLTESQKRMKKAFEQRGIPFLISNGKWVEPDYKDEDRDITVAWALTRLKEIDNLLTAANLFDERLEDYEILEDTIWDIWKCLDKLNKKLGKLRNFLDASEDLSDAEKEVNLAKKKLKEAKKWYEGRKLAIKKVEGSEYESSQEDKKC